MCAALALRIAPYHTVVRNVTLCITAILIVEWYRRFRSGTGNQGEVAAYFRFSPKPEMSLHRSETPLCATSRHMQCSKQPVNLGAFGQVLGSLTDYNLASADEDDLSVLRNIAPSHHGHIVEIDPNGLRFEIGTLHPRCHSRKLFFIGIDPASIQISLSALVKLDRVHQGYTTNRITARSHSEERRTSARR